ncbi:hypothetical protein U9893_26025, partial [Escherichia coli]
EMTGALPLAQRLTAREKISRPVHRFQRGKRAILTCLIHGTREIDRESVPCIAMQRTQKLSDAFLGLRMRESMFFDILKRKSVQIRCF